MIRRTLHFTNLPFFEENWKHYDLFIGNTSLVNAFDLMKFKVDLMNTLKEVQIVTGS